MQIDGNTPVTITLSLDKVNNVLGALSAQPYQQVAGLIAEIQLQASTQLKAAQPQPGVVKDTEKKAA